MPFIDVLITLQGAFPAPKKVPKQWLTGPGINLVVLVAALSNAHVVLSSLTTTTFETIQLPPAGSPSDSCFVNWQLRITRILRHGLCVQGRKSHGCVTTVGQREAVPLRQVWPLAVPLGER